MMTVPKRLTWLPMAALGVLLASALVFLYAKSRDYDPANYFENVALLRQIKQLDARWELDAMKSKIGINKTYDPLVDPLLELNNLQQQLDAVASNQKGDNAHTLKYGIKAFESALQKKAGLIEHFKSHNAVLRNSLAFLPTAADDIRILARQGNGREAGVLGSVAVRVNKVLLASLLYDQAASDDKAVEIESELGRLVADKENLSTDSVGRVDIFVAHVRTVLREHGVVNGLLNSIAATPTAARIDDINNTLSIEQRRASMQAQKYRQYLLLFAAVLIGLFLYAAVRLIRSHADINRVNKELQHVNDNLEQRVKQRTHELKTTNEALLDDIIERKLVEQALRLKHQAIEASINAIFLIKNRQPDNPIEYVNPSFQRMTGYTAAEVTGKNIRFLLGEDQDQPGIQIILDAMRQNGEGHAVLRNYRKDGTLFWSECYVAGVRDNAETTTHFVVVLNDITDTKQLEEQLHHRANYDVLTKLPNRVLLMDRIVQTIAIANRQQRQMVVAFVDLDRFKFINDTLGHDAGDMLLQEIAGRLRECVRESDTVARLGGDEFVILLHPESADGDQLSVMQRIVERIAQPVTLLGEEHTVTCSIGISIFPQDGHDAETLLKHADRAMYCAKELGRNSYQFYASEMNAKIQERNWMQEGLLNAIARDEFRLLYQPQVDLRSGHIIGVEALIRWQHLDLGMILPAKFIPQAEESGLIVPIGDWVLRTACKQNKAWQDAGMPVISMSVNVSARQFVDKDLIHRVENALQESGMAARYLELELTESVIMRDSQQAMATMRKLQAMGVRISIDDFGTGYSSLRTLKLFPVARLKIDQSFVCNIPADPDDKAIAMAVISLGHQFNLKVIAEGVETEQQLAFLRDNDCDEMQGYHFSRPVSAEEIEKLFQAPGQLGHRFTVLSV